MAVPAVQNLDQIMAELNPVYQGQIDNTNQQIAGLGATTAATKSGLTAQKNQGFNQINNQATGRGLSFSGIPLDEQATYLSTKYLPGIQQADATEASNRLTLQGTLAGINSDKASKALATRQNQQSALDSYLAQEQDRQFQAQQSELNRQNQIQLQRMQAQAAAAAQAATAAKSTFSTAKNTNGGSNFYDPNGNAVTAAQFFKAQGGNVGDVANFLKNDSDKTSQKAYADLTSKKYTAAQLASKYPYIFGGV